MIFLFKFRAKLKSPFDLKSNLFRLLIKINLKNKRSKKMFEAKLTEGHIFKKIVEAIKDLVTDVNIDVSPSGKYSLMHLLKRTILF